MALKVLVPLDGSTVTFKALDRALALLKGRPGVEVTLLNVISEGFENAPEDVRELFDEDEDDEVFPTEEAGRRMMAKAMDLCRQHDQEARSEVIHGGVNETILKYCRTHDLLVMHALESGQLKEKLRGSQTERLARKAGIPVLLL